MAFIAVVEDVHCVFQALTALASSRPPSSLSSSSIPSSFFDSHLSAGCSSLAAVFPSPFYSSIIINLVNIFTFIYILHVDCDC
eukprot:m.53147 g.53147  ORF g.53147 m.53147 type:complete len:83 (-) comp12766_c0_seq1:1527-1775(-)